MSRVVRLEEIEDQLRALTVPPVVLVGQCPHGLAILRGFAKRGIPVYAIESNYQQSSARSRFGVKLHCPSLDGPELLDLLVAIGRRAARKPLLLVTNDRMVRLLNPEQGRLRAWYHIPFPDPDILTRLIDKEPLAELARSRGLRIPTTLIVESSADVARAGEAVRYPCILKPAMPMSSFKVLLIPDEGSLTRAIDTYPDIKRFIIQSWVAGADRNIFFVAYYFGSDGRVLATFAGQKIRQYPRTLGNTSAARGVDRPDLVREGHKLFENLGYKGIASVEFKLGPEGEPHFIEATVGRTDYWYQTLPANGVDLLYAVYEDLALGRPAPAATQRNRKIWVDVDRDWEVYVESFLDPDVSKGDLFRFLLAPKELALFDWNDPTPCLHWAPRFVGRVLAKIASRLKCFGR